ncbi:MAG: hypothetical protein WC854_14260 [Bacteroidales bacterium]
MIKQAIEALDKATPGPWETWQTERDGCGYLSIGPNSMEPGTHDEIVCDITSILTLNEKDRANAKQIKAAPNMAAWIQKALPWIEWSKEKYTSEIRDMLIAAGLTGDDVNIPNVKIRMLDALIAEATR